MGQKNGQTHTRYSHLEYLTVFHFFPSNLVHTPVCAYAAQLENLSNYSFSSLHAVPCSTKSVSLSLLCCWNKNSELDWMFWSLLWHTNMNFCGTNTVWAFICYLLCNTSTEIYCLYSVDLKRRLMQKSIFWCNSGVYSHKSSLELIK